MVLKLKAKSDLDAIKEFVFDNDKMLPIIEKKRCVILKRTRVYIDFKNEDIKFSPIPHGFCIDIKNLARNADNNAILECIQKSYTNTYVAVTENYLKNGNPAAYEIAGHVESLLNNLNVIDSLSNEDIACFLELLTSTKTGDNFDVFDGDESIDLLFTLNTDIKNQYLMDPEVQEKIIQYLMRPEFDWSFKNPAIAYRKLFQVLGDRFYDVVYDKISDITNSTRLISLLAAVVVYDPDKLFELWPRFNEEITKSGIFKDSLFNSSEQKCQNIINALTFSGRKIALKVPLPALERMNKLPTNFTVGITNSKLDKDFVDNIHVSVNYLINNDITYFVDSTLVSNLRTIQDAEKILDSSSPKIKLIDLFLVNAKTDNHDDYDLVI